MENVKIFAAYLPQYHETEDNNKFWGEGFTDWIGVKKAKPLFEGQVQPRIPLGRYYYDLSQKNDIKWQSEIANKYGVDGFNIYHYWFKDGKQELHTPAEIILNNHDIQIEFFFTWDNGAWKRTWSNLEGNDWAPAFDSKKNVNDEHQILVEFNYGDEIAWRKHFDYLLPFFKDKRYLKIDNKPVFMIMTPTNNIIQKDMASYWERLAKDNGFSGMFMVSRHRVFNIKTTFDHDFVYEPIASGWGVRRAMENRLKKYFGFKGWYDKPVKYLYNYDKVWKKIIHSTLHYSDKTIPGCFVRYDDTPRRGNMAGIILGETPEKFYNYFKQFYEIVTSRRKKLLLITAWNEWGEGSYLEPDEVDGYAYLESLHRAKSEVNNTRE